VVSKLQIRLKSKAQTDEKAQSRLRRDEQYILKRFSTQLLALDGVLKPLLDSIIAGGDWIFLAFVRKAKNKHPKDPVNPVYRKITL